MDIPDPLAHWLPWLGAAREALSSGRYVVMRRQVKRRIAEREAAECLRRGSVLLSQMCLLHGLPQDTSALQTGPPLWCGCTWQRDVIYARGGKAQRVIRVGRRDPVTGAWLVASWADTGSSPGDEVLEQAREALRLGR